MSRHQQPRHLPYDRAERVAGELQAIIAEFCLCDIKDPRAHGMQVTKVRVSKDLRLARINYFISGTDAQREGCQIALEHAQGALKRAISDRLSLKFMPELKFHFDDSVEHGARIEELLREIHRD